MSKKPIKIYTDLTIIKQDVLDLIDIFQSNLQDVEIMIDDQPIFESEQLEQFDATYRATSLLARGYWPEIIGEGVKSQGERRLIELKISRVSAILTNRKKSGQKEDELIKAVSNILLRHCNRTHHSWVFTVILPFFSIGVILQPIARRYYSSFVAQTAFMLGIGICLEVVALFALGIIARFFKVDARIFLFPGMTEIKKTYGRRETIGAVIVALSLFVFMTLSVFFLFSMLHNNFRYNNGYNSGYNSGYEQGVHDANATMTAQAQKKH